MKNIERYKLDCFVESVQRSENAIGAFCRERDRQRRYLNELVDGMLEGAEPGRVLRLAYPVWISEAPGKVGGRSIGMDCEGLVKRDDGRPLMWGESGGNIVTREVRHMVNYPDCRRLMMALVFTILPPSEIPSEWHYLY